MGTTGYKQHSPEWNFWLCVGLTPVDDCWLYRGANPIRHTTLLVDGRQVGVHRFSYQLHHGEVPDGMFVCHSCDMPTCVNPKHLFLGTTQDNTQDSTLKGRRAHGEQHGMAKLTTEQVEEIRSSELGCRRLARAFNTSATNIKRIRNRRTWSSVP